MEGKQWRERARKQGGGRAEQASERTVHQVRVSFLNDQGSAVLRCNVDQVDRIVFCRSERSACFSAFSNGTTHREWRAAIL